MKNEKETQNKRLYYAIGIYVAVFLLVVTGILIYKLSDRNDYDVDDYSFPQETIASETEDVSSVESVSSLENESSASEDVSSNVVRGLDPKFSKLLLVNGKNPLPNKEKYEQNLTTIDAKYLCGELNQLDKDVLPYAIALMEAAKDEGVDIRVRSPYRSYETQERLYNNEVSYWLKKGMGQAEAEDKAATIVARPGTSEHHCGFAIDFNQTNSAFEESDAFRWMLNNAADYGFILRYPEEKQDITGVIYEPWHWRFVGIDVAKDINSKNMCLEEYIEEINNKGSANQ